MKLHKATARKLAKELPACGMNWETGNRDKPVNAIAWRLERGEVALSAENGNAVADYYDGQGLGEFGIHQTLHDWASERGYFWEWINAAEIILAR